MLILHTGDQPIKRISQPRHKKNDERLIESAVDQQPNVAGNQENTEDGQAVRKIHMSRSTAETAAGGDDRRAVHGCQRLEVGSTPPYNHRPQLSQVGVGEVVMSSLPLLFKKEGLIEKHQVEGVDPSDRYFNRTVLVNRTPSGYVAKVMYEALNVEGHSHPTIGAAVQELIEAMQKFGFSKLRTRANFKGTKYLAEKETWVDYQDRA
jgi:hypothetical protein